MRKLSGAGGGACTSSQQGPAPGWPRRLLDVPQRPTCRTDTGRLSCRPRRGTRPRGHRGRETWSTSARRPACNSPRNRRSSCEWYASMTAPHTKAGAGSTATNSTPTATRSSGARSSSRRQVSRGSDHRHVAYRGTCGRAPRGPWAANLERPPQKEHPASGNHERPRRIGWWSSMDALETW